ncbi:unnamed protein product [Acanthoscelides obtectus]|uniref:Uncharacterized protein n=1 Tax=Acanthoscelides obtectus TaxID=200917 RepID=A0A9P0LBW6_ACAOB|nr:unnamed protein product [Acanthoscelides obtectus]CAK1674011.1 Stearoyl-CoA desaturase 5 [Acanthoscelides obtectus]
MKFSYTIATVPRRRSSYGFRESAQWRRRKRPKTKQYYLPIYIFLSSLVVAVPVWLWNETLTNSILSSHFFRWILYLNITMCVNSWAHFFGTKPYDKYIRPIESNLLSFLIVGEGWHNYHHTFPWDYQAAEYGLHYSLTTFLIELSSYLGLAHDLKSASQQTVEKRRLRTGNVPLKGQPIDYNSNGNNNNNRFLLRYTL